ncbi:MAG: hypothetical protein RMZ41_029475 [Nostoc sp. DedVER02]|uniref:hypothetical protein n=1 Tax=unclassified Nostoc TaxID=2593658 RepID=UPI002AD3F06E|nr:MULTISPECIES: hypothetical protein [unclassified Nostoc]MDZ7985764.1 hypothetical protein [Nostoc sp. DedVER02]MDZ8114840.1 hypothetical protein [Nostoc sp. DedVER01b]
MTTKLNSKNQCGLDKKKRSQSNHAIALGISVILNTISQGKLMLSAATTYGNTCRVLGKRERKTFNLSPLTFPPNPIPS